MKRERNTEGTGEMALRLVERENRKTEKLGWKKIARKKVMCREKGK